jgi:hypothetical protein
VHRPGAQMAVADFLSRSGEGGVSWRPDVTPAFVGRWGYVGGHATSGLQGEYGQVGSTPDLLGG